MKINYKYFIKKQLFKILTKLKNTKQFVFYKIFNALGLIIKFSLKPWI